MPRRQCVWNRPSCGTKVLTGLEDAFRASVAEVPLLQATGMALARLRGSGVVDFFLEQMATGEPTLRLAAARALGQVALEGDEVVQNPSLSEPSSGWTIRRRPTQPAWCWPRWGGSGMFQVLAEERLPEVLKRMAGQELCPCSRLAGRVRKWNRCRSATQWRQCLDMALLPVPASAFPMGTRRRGCKDERPQHQSTSGVFTWPATR